LIVRVRGVAQGETCAHKAGRSGDGDLLMLLRELGADMDALNKEVRACDDVT
jgi:hypothetical protein